jgi:hypothetical protein
MADDLSGVTALASVGVAALAVIFAPLTARLTYKWTKAADDERWKRERDADSERWDREERKRRILRGEEAAKEVLTDVDRALLILTRTDRADDESIYDELRPVYHHIRQQAELLTDDEAQARILKVADNIYYHSQARELAPNVTRWVVGHTCSDTAHAILRAYLHGRPLPRTPRMERLQHLHDEGGELLEEIHESEDPLAEPPDQATEDPSGTPGSS